jgi:hypothetical protein
MKERIESISLSPDAVMKVTLNLLAVETKISLLSEALEFANARVAADAQGWGKWW